MKLELLWVPGARTWQRGHYFGSKCLYVEFAFLTGAWRYFHFSISNPIHGADSFFNGKSDSRVYIEPLSAVSL
jgi:hypothetical protein